VAFLGIDQAQLADALFATTLATDDNVINGTSPNQRRQ